MTLDRLACLGSVAPGLMLKINKGVFLVSNSPLERTSSSGANMQGKLELESWRCTLEATQANAGPRSGSASWYRWRCGWDDAGRGNDEGRQRQPANAAAARPAGCRRVDGSGEEGVLAHARRRRVHQKSIVISLTWAAGEGPKRAWPRSTLLSPWSDVGS